MSIQEFYSIITDLWNQLTLTKLAKLKVHGAYINHNEQQKMV
jgi:hypothetical protein